jgi:hypothetical protein
MNEKDRLSEDEARKWRNAKCANCEHTQENHDYSGCRCWINADASTPCLCKKWKPETMAPEKEGGLPS